MLPALGISKAVVDGIPHECFAFYRQNCCTRKAGLKGRNSEHNTDVELRTSPFLATIGIIQLTKNTTKSLYNPLLTRLLSVRPER